MTLLWFLAGVVFALLELAYPALVVIFFAFGAFGAAVFSALGLSLQVTIGVFIVLSVLSLIGLRRHLKTIFSGRARRAPEGTAHPMTGQRGVVTRPIRPGETGEVSVGGSFWRAVADTDLPEGAPVRVLGTLDGNDLTLRVQAEDAGKAPPPER